MHPDRTVTSTITSMRQYGWPTSCPYQLCARRTPIKSAPFVGNQKATHRSKLVAVAANPDPVSLHPAVALWYSQHLVLVPHRPHPVTIYADQPFHHALLGLERIPARGGHDGSGEVYSSGSTTSYVRCDAA